MKRLDRLFWNKEREREISPQMRIDSIFRLGFFILMEGWSMYRLENELFELLLVASLIQLYLIWLIPYWKYSYETVRLRRLVQKFSTKYKLSLRRFRLELLILNSSIDPTFLIYDNKIEERSSTIEKEIGNSFSERKRECFTIKTRTSDSVAPDPVPCFTRPRAVPIVLRY